MFVNKLMEIGVTCSLAGAYCAREWELINHTAYNSILTMCLMIVATILWRIFFKTTTV